MGAIKKVNKTKILILGAVALALLVVPLASHALSGVNASKITVKIFTKQGNEWFKARTVKTNSNGVLTFKNALPGHYKGVVKDADQATPQYVAAKFRMLDNEGRRINHKTDVNIYTVSGSTKTLALATESDEDGWVNMAALFPETDYFIEVKEGSSLSQKDNQPRIKVKAKIDGSKWFRASMKRVNKDGVLTLKDVISGKYKFKYKSGDADPSQPFTLKAKLRKNNGKKITSKTRVDLYTYINGSRIKIAELKTTSKGWITVPGVMTGMKYKIKVKD